MSNCDGSNPENESMSKLVRQTYSVNVMSITDTDKQFWVSAINCTLTTKRIILIFNRLEGPLV